MRKHILVVVTAILLLATVAMAADPFVGTWKLNVPKSRFSPRPAYRSQTVKNEAKANGLIVTMDTVDFEGKTTHAVYDFMFDGKDHPYAGIPNADTFSFRRIDANTIDYVGKKSGREVWWGSIVLSKDGKTTTETSKQMDAKGQEIAMILVNDKQ